MSLITKRIQDLYLQQHMVARIGRPGYGSDIRSPQLIRLTRVSTNGSLVSSVCR